MARLSSGQQDEVAELYAKTDTPIPEILNTYGIGKSTLYGLITDRNLPRRDQRASESIRAYQARRMAEASEPDEPIGAVGAELEASEPDERLLRTPVEQTRKATHQTDEYRERMRRERVAWAEKRFEELGPQLRQEIRDVRRRKVGTVHELMSAYKLNGVVLGRVLAEPDLSPAQAESAQAAPSVAAETPVATASPRPAPVPPRAQGPILRRIETPRVEEPRPPAPNNAPRNGGSMTIKVDDQSLVTDARRVENDVHTPEWEVEFTGTISVHAESIEVALREARKLGVVRRIVGINLKRG